MSDKQETVLDWMKVKGYKFPEWATHIVWYNR